MSYADTTTAPRAPKIGFKVEVKHTPPPPPNPEDRRPWWRRLWDTIRNFIRIDVR